MLALFSIIPISPAICSDACCKSCGVSARVERSKKGAATIVAETENVFTGANIQIVAGDTVTWTNNGMEHHTATSDQGLWDSGDMKPGDSYSRTFKKIGAYPYSCVYHRTLGMRGTITVVAPPPTIVSALSAMGAVGAAFSYRIDTDKTAGMFSADPLPAGLSLSGNVISGVPMQAGTFAVTLMAGNADGSSSKILALQILDTIAESDRDGDGFPDALESIADSSPDDAASTPFGIAPNLAQPLTITKLSIALNFTAAGNDSIMLAGTLPTPSGFSPFAQQLALDVGGVVRLFRLDLTGAEISRTDAIKLNASGAGDAPFSVKLTRGNFAATLAAMGLDGAVNVSKALKTIPVTVLFNGVQYRTVRIVSYSARANRRGRAK
ncbi:MAG TPA: plastocyanin/azurin family copper-binding protein [Planctomycetota bacterium]|nr:plastocyanin/azurin family copper-binding protein [Planctomycetota bacterium]